MVAASPAFFSGPVDCRLLAADFATTSLACDDDREIRPTREERGIGGRSAR
jgi:hypothetical protein